MQLEVSQMVLTRSPLSRSQHSWSVETLEAREVPSVVAGTPQTLSDAELAATSQPVEQRPMHPKRFAIASGPGQSAQVSIYEAGSNALLGMLLPFGREYTGGVTVATADLTGDGIDDVVVAKASEGSAVKVFDGVTRQSVAEFDAFAGAKTGAFISVGDVTGDGRVDLVLGSGQGNTVKVIRGQDVLNATPTNAPTIATEITAFAVGFTGGVRVAVGDVNGDGLADIIAAPGAGGPAQVKIFTTSAKWGDTPNTTYAHKLTTLSVGGVRDTGGVFVSAGDLNGDGKADIAVGRVVGGRATVSVFSGANLRTRLFNGFGFTSTRPGGVPVSLRDLDGDGKAELIAGGGDGVSQVRVFGAGGALKRSFMAFTPNYRGGVYVG
jgi:FG-GAP-like repeat